MYKRIDIINGQEVEVKVYAPKPLPKKVTVGTQVSKPKIIAAYRRQKSFDARLAKQQAQREKELADMEAKLTDQLDYLIAERDSLRLAIDEVNRKIRNLDGRKHRVVTGIINTR